MQEETLVLGHRGEGSGRRLPETVHFDGEGYRHPRQGVARSGRAQYSHSV